MTELFIRPTDLDTDFVITAGNKVKLNAQASLTQDATGAWGVDITQLDIVDSVAGNLITVGPNGGAVFNQAALQAAETAWAGSVAAGSELISIAPGGTNNHGPVFSIDYSNAAFREAVSDRVGEMALAGANISFDDVADSITSALTNLVAGSSIAVTGANTISLVLSTDADNLAKFGTDGNIMIDAADVSALATVELCGLDGVPVAKAFPV